MTWEISDSPTCSPYDSADLLLENAKLRCQIALFDPTCGISLADFLDLLHGEFGHSMIDAPIVGQHSSALTVTISVVVSDGAKEPAVGILTIGDVAMMEDVHPRGNRFDEVFVGPSRGDDHSGGSTWQVGAIPELGMTLLEEGSGPSPALVRPQSLDLRPIPLLDRQASTHASTLKEVA